MGDQSPSYLRLRRKLSSTEHHVVPDRVGIRVYVARRLLGGRTGVYPHSGKVVSKTLFHALP